MWKKLSKRETLAIGILIEKRISENNDTIKTLKEVTCNSERIIEALKLENAILENAEKKLLKY